MALFSRRPTETLPYYPLLDSSGPSLNPDGPVEIDAYHALRPYWLPAMVGIPFGPGPGLGLDQAVAQVEPYFEASSIRAHR